MRCAAVCGALAVAGALSLPAQAPEGVASLTRAAVADSQRVVRELERRVKASPDDAAAWHRLGEVAWIVAEYNLRPPVTRRVEMLRLRTRGGDALYRAVALAPDSLEYRRTLARFIVRAMDGVLPWLAVRYANEVLALLPDSIVEPRAEAALKVGKILWGSYETMAHRRISNERLVSVLGLMGRPADQAGFVMSPLPSDYFFAITNLLSNTNEQPFEVAGEARYLEAQQFLQVAYDMRPRDPETFHALAVLHLGLERWTELARLARHHTELVGDDPWGWMALGLALARTRDHAGAREAFAEGLSRFDDEDRRSLDRLERVLPPREAAAFAALDADTRDAAAATHWFLADPLWSSDEEEPRLEFLARIAYAELRWSNPARSERGVDTDRGRVHVRYGPADVIARVSSRGGAPIAGRDLTQELIGDPFVSLGRSGPAVEGGPGLTLFWVYDAGLVFAFNNLTRLAAMDQSLNDHAFASQPARFDNIALVQIDSMPVQLARFRAGTDSVELFAASRAPLSRMREMAAAGTPVAAMTWAYGYSVPDAIREPLSIAADGTILWARALRAGDYLWRVETTAEGVLAAGRAVARVRLREDTATGFTLRGFGVSDILLGAALGGEALPVSRWRDARVAPLIGPLTGQRTIALVWETYEPADSAGAAHYDVVVTMERIRGRAGQVVASVVGALASFAGVDSRRNTITIRYRRVVPHAPILVEQLILDLGQTGPGEYALNVEVRDAVSGKAVRRGTRVTVE